MGVSCAPAGISQISANLITTLVCFGGSAPDSRFIAGDGVFIVDAGESLSLFCCAAMTTPLAGADDLSRRIGEVKTYFGSRGGWAIWHCEALCDERLRRTARRVYRDHGLLPGPTCPGMVAETLREPARRLPPIEIRPVSDAATRQSFTHIMTTAFDGATAQLRIIYSSAAFWRGAFSGFIGSSGGADVTAGATVVSDGVIGLYAVGTLPGHTRRGYAEAAMREAIHQARREHGNLPVVLQSSEHAVRLYKRMGFRSLTNYAIFTAPVKQ